MYVIVTITVGLVFWITAWAFGIKALDAFLVTSALAVGAAAVYVFTPYLRRALGSGSDGPGSPQRR